MAQFFPYASPEQVFTDKANFARKNIARGRSIVALEYENGILFLAENPSTMLHKFSEVYDRIAFAGVGKYSEYEMLRKEGIRYAEVFGFRYSRDDVTARSLANVYSETLDRVFREAFKPFEVEILVSQVADNGSGDSEMFRIQPDGTMSDEDDFAAIGGHAEDLSRYLRQNFTPRGALTDAIRTGVEALQAVDGRAIPSARLEAAVLDRQLGRRKFRRLAEGELTPSLPPAPADAS